MAARKRRMKGEGVVSDGRHGKDEASTSIVAWLQARLERVTADRDRLARDLAEREKLDRVTFAADLPAAAAGEQTGPHPVVPAQRPRSRHAAQDRTHLRLVKVLIPAAAAGLWAALRHLLAAGPAVQAAAAVTLTAAVVTAGAVAVQHTPGLAQAVGAGAAPTAPDGGTTAVPIVLPPAQRLIAAISRPAGMPKLDVRSSATTAPGLPPTFDYVPPVQGSAPSPGGGQSSQPSWPSQSSAQSGQPGAGYLAADTTNGTQQIDLGPAGAGTLTTTISLSASGGDVAWGAVPRLGPDASAAGDTVTLDSYQGQVGDGGSGAVGVTIMLSPSDNGGSVTVRIWGGSGPAVMITITWEAAPPPAPADPSPADTSVPTPTSS